MADRLEVCATGMYDPDGPAGSKITPWRSNAELIAQGCGRLGYLDGPRWLDPTYGKGNWWTQHAPPGLVHHDIKHDGVDFRQLPHPDASFDGAAFDPPYVVPGGTSTSGMKDFHDSFGMDGNDGSGGRLFKNPAELLAMNVAGLAELGRVVRPGGLVLCKTANFVWSGKLQISAHEMVERARALGFTPIDSFVYVGGYRAQPKRTRKCPTCGGIGKVAELVDDDAVIGAGQLVTVTCDDCSGVGRVESPQGHARQNVSYLWVLRVPARSPQGTLT